MLSIKKHIVIILLVSLIIFILGNMVALVTNAYVYIKVQLVLAILSTGIVSLFETLYWSVLLLSKNKQENKSYCGFTTVTAKNCHKFGDNCSECSMQPRPHNLELE